MTMQIIGKKDDTQELAIQHPDDPDGVIIYQIDNKKVYDELVAQGYVEVVAQ